MNISEFCKIYTGTGFPIEFQGKKDGKYPFYKVSDISASNAQQKIFLGRANNYIDESTRSSLHTMQYGVEYFVDVGTLKQCMEYPMTYDLLDQYSRIVSNPYQL